MNWLMHYYRGLHENDEWWNRGVYKLSSMDIRSTPEFVRHHTRKWERLESKRQGRRSVYAGYYYYNKSDLITKKHLQEPIDRPMLFSNHSMELRWGDQ